MSEFNESSEHPDARHQRLGKQDGFSRFAAIIVPAFIAVLVAMAGQGVLAWRDIAILNHTVKELADTYVTDIATLAAIAEQAHANTIHRVEHERQAARYIAKIEVNERAIIELQSNARARPDPFTGTDGDKLRHRIERLEQETIGGGSRRP
jgi:hypothetical protein